MSYTSVVVVLLLLGCVCARLLSVEITGARWDGQTVPVRLSGVPVGIPAASRQLVGRQVGVGKRLRIRGQRQTDFLSPLLYMTLKVRGFSRRVKKKEKKNPKMFLFCLRIRKTS